MTDLKDFEGSITERIVFYPHDKKLRFLGTKFDEIKIDVQKDTSLNIKQEVLEAPHHVTIEADNQVFRCLEQGKTLLCHTKRKR